MLLSALDERALVRASTKQDHVQAIYHRCRATEKQQAMEKFDVFPTTGQVLGAAIRDNEGTAHPYGDVLAGPSRWSMLLPSVDSAYHPYEVSRLTRP